jgi:hypothetical protein
MIGEAWGKNKRPAGSFCRGHHLTLAAEYCGDHDLPPGGLNSARRSNTVSKKRLNCTKRSAQPLVAWRAATASRPPS